MEVQRNYDGESLLVDELFDFSCGDFGGICEEDDQDGLNSIFGELAQPSSSALTSIYDHGSSCSFSSSSLSSSSLDAPEAVESFYSPPEGMKGRTEWFSMFVEDSKRADDKCTELARDDLCFIKGRGRMEFLFENSEVEKPLSTSWLRMTGSGTFCEFLDLGATPLTELTAPDSVMKNYGWDKKGRSKRSSRNGGRAWTLQTALALKSKAPAPSATPDASQPHLFDEDEDDDYHSQASSLEYEPSYSYDEEQKARKKLKKEKRAGGAGGGEEGRRCSHCQVQKTPQWRAGPLGPKTLCNACGVRYKSGRLLPEYRPAASPTFISELHSNSHKKVLEMRNSKTDTTETTSPSLMMPPPSGSTPLPCPFQQEDQEQEEFSSCSQESTVSTESRP
ncbi:hypothetical protein KP509_34G071700 [Ceratopteris richardii]|uniref:GATA-type domain-containing protein n=1 Tax=Ceratopteris richardii TaxID=49495 RepID=A0A8T2QLX0_CERRI|nr:hypothetical protein KP509_34G071700 [Ceratopteris richardii]